MLKPSFILLLAVALTGCQTTEERRAEFARGNNYFIDKNSDELVLKRGVPTAVFDLSTGGRILEYSKSDRHRTSGYSYTSYTPMKVNGKTVQVPSKNYVPGSRYTTSCRVAFTVSEQNIVTGWNGGNGNGCY